MKYTQQVLYPIDLPQFLLSFKNACTNLLLPQLGTLINYLQSPQVNHAYSFLFTSILLLLIVNSLLKNILSAKPIQYNTQNNSSQFQQFKAQIKKMKSIVKKLMDYPIDSEQNDKEKELTTNAENNTKIINKIKNLISIYRETVQQNEKISEFIIDSHEQLINEIKKIKKIKFFTEKSYSHSSGSIQEVVISNSKEYSTFQNSNSNEKKLDLTKEIGEKEDTSSYDTKQRQKEGIISEMQHMKSREDEETQETNNEVQVKKVNKKIPPPSKAPGRRSIPAPPNRKL